MFPLVLNFPFRISGEECHYTCKTNIERKENLVSFALELKYPIEVEGGECLSITSTNGLFVYVFKFEDINRAMEFMEETTVGVKKVFEFPDVDRLVEKTNRLMVEYEEREKGHKKKKRRKLVEDGEGFMKYQE